MLVLADLVERGAALDSGMWRRVYDRLALGAVPPDPYNTKLPPDPYKSPAALGAGIASCANTVTRTINPVTAYATDVALVTACSTITVNGLQHRSQSGCGLSGERG